MNMIENLADRLASTAAVVDNGEFRWAVNRAQAEAWSKAHLGRGLRSSDDWSEETDAAFCRDVPLLVDWTVGTPEMIALCRALIDRGAPLYRI